MTFLPMKQPTILVFPKLFWHGNSRINSSLAPSYLFCPLTCSILWLIAQRLQVYRAH
jgi:hypothetical protein